MTKSKAALLLLPNLLGECKYHEPYLPASVDKAVEGIDGLIAESENGGRRYLGRFDLGGRRASNIPIAVFKGKEEDLDFYLEPILEGERWGLVSDAGLPCVADPGAMLVRKAQQQGITVQAFVGPSSLMLALMLSGLPGQQFSFHGYPRKHSTERVKQLTKWEAAIGDGTQIFIEAPHRNRVVLDQCIDVLQPETMLCVAWDLTLQTQGVITAPVSQWRKMDRPNLDKRPAIFLIGE